MGKRTVSEETKRKISDALKKRWEDKEFRERMLPNIQKGQEVVRQQEVSEETRKKLSESAKRQWQDKGTREKMQQGISEAKKGKHVGSGNPMYGKTHSQETREKIGQKQQEAWLREDVAAKKIKALKDREPTFTGKNHSDESKALISQKAKERFADPEWRAGYIEARKPLFEKEQWKDRQSKSQKKLWESPDRWRKCLGGFSRKKLTSLEVAVKDVLDELGIEYHAQKVIGRCIIDFFIPGLNLCLEADGKYWHDMPEVAKRDKRRDWWLRSKGYIVIRLTEAEIKTDVLGATTEALQLNN